MKEKNNKIGLFVLIGLVVVILLAVFIKGGKTDKPAEKTMENIDYFELLDKQAENLELTTDGILNRLDKEVTKAEDGFPLIDQTLYTIQIRGYKYEELLTNLNDSVLNNKDAIVKGKYYSVSDRVLRGILENIEEDGYDLVYKDQHFLLNYDISDILQKYEKILPKDYIDAKLKVQKYNLMSIKEDVEEKGEEVSRLKFKEVGDALVDLDKSVAEVSYEPIKAELQDVILYYSSLLTGLVDQNLVLVNQENINPEMLKTMKKVEQNAKTKEMKGLMKNLIELANSEDKLSKAFLDKSIMYIYSYVDENNEDEDIIDVEEYKNETPIEEQVEITDQVEDVVEEVKSNIESK